MTRGALGRLILSRAKFEDVEVEGGIKIRVRPMNALHLFAFRQLTAGSKLEEKTGDAVFDIVFEKDPQFLPKLLSDCCFDPDSGEPALDIADAARLPKEVFSVLVVKILMLSQTPGESEVKA